MTAPFDLAGRSSHRTEPASHRSFGRLTATLVATALLTTALALPGAAAPPAEGPHPASGPADTSTRSSSFDADATSGIIVTVAADHRAEEARRRLAEWRGGERVGRTDLGSATTVLEFADGVDRTEAQRLADRLVRERLVASATPDLPVTTTAAPDDPGYPFQWHLRSRYQGAAAAGIDVEAAWGLTTGSPEVTVAVLDTGILDHPDIRDRLVAGYDFVDDDDDASDPGDWCGTNPSSWHGSHVAGTIGASTDNGVGVAGVDQQVAVQPVRVIGPCGGELSDVLAGIRWAAGLDVPGTSTNDTPAEVLNLSLGVESATCPDALQRAVREATTAGSLVIAAAGNTASDAGGFTPGNCDEVLTVTATSRVGDRAFYANTGAVVDLAAPGGDSRYDDPEALVLSLSNTSPTTPDPDGMAYAWQQGTSQAAPHVAGVATLALALDRSLTPSGLRDLLTGTTQPFATTSPNGDDSLCSDDPTTPEHCGTGIADAGAAIAALLEDTSEDEPVDPPEEEPAPQAPELSATAGQEAVSLGWTASSHTTGIDRYELHGTTDDTCSRDDDLWYSGSDTLHTAVGLEGGTTYRFCVVAIAGDGQVSPLSNQAEARPDAPPPPPSWHDAQLAFDLEDGDLRLFWPRPDDGEADHYEVRVDGALVRTTTARSVLLRALADGVQIEVEVVAVNASGTSEPLARTFTPSGGFADVTTGSTFDLDVRWLATGEVTRGCDAVQFCPGEPVTRQQMAAFLARALDLTATSGIRFDDVPAGSTFEEDIDKLATEGVTLGCAADRFCPGDPVTRRQMAAFLSRALDLTDTSGVRFADVPANSTLEMHVDQLATAGITQGCTQDRFCPDGQVTRQQMAAFLRRGLT